MSIFRPCCGAAAALLVSAAPLLAQGDQQGLVNVDVSGNPIQVPVGVAANICDIDVSVIAKQVGTEETACEIGQDTAAEDGGTGGGDSGKQRGLVNVAIADNTVQVPISVAANICDVDVNVLASKVGKEETACEVGQDTSAESGGDTEGGDTEGTDTTEGVTDTMDETIGDTTEGVTDTVVEPTGEETGTVEDTLDTAN